MINMSRSSTHRKIENLVRLDSVVQAELLALQLLESNPDCNFSKFYIGLLAVRRGDEDRALHFWSAIDEFSFIDGLSIYRAAQEAVEIRGWRAARKLLTEYIKNVENAAAPIWLLLGQVLDHDGERGLAVKAWFRAIRLAQDVGEWKSEASTPTEIVSAVRYAVDAVNAGRRTLFEKVLEDICDKVDPRSLIRLNRAVAHYLDLSLDGPSDHRQAPKFFYYPGLTDQPYHDTQTQCWASEVTAAFPVIRQEALALLAESGSFESFLTFGPETNRRDYVTGNGPAPAWDAFFFYRHGQRIDAHHARCPQTSALLERIERCEIAGQAPEICFSLLAPGSHILPHYGVTNTRLVMHLPLLVPTGCALNIVDAGEHHWREGELVMFDDTFQHEAWNHSDMPRVILLMDCWNPELTIEERLAVKKLVEAISDFENHF